MVGPGPSKATVDRLRERKETAERTFDTILSRQRATAAIWRTWKDESDPAKKAATYARLRTIVLGHPSLGALVIRRETTIEDYEAAEAAFARTA